MPTLTVASNSCATALAASKLTDEHVPIDFIVGLPVSGDLQQDTPLTRRFSHGAPPTAENPSFVIALTGLTVNGAMILGISVHFFCIH